MTDNNLLKWFPKLNHAEIAQLFEWTKAKNVGEMGFMSRKHVVKKIPLSDRQRKVLVAMAEYYDRDENFVYFNTIAQDLYMPDHVVRVIVRALVRKKLARHSQLFDCDGKVCGSGHRCTALGKLLVEALDELGTVPPRT